MVDFKKWWNKKSVVSKSVWVGVFASLSLSILFAFLPTGLESLIRGRFVCATFGGDIGCGNPPIVGLTIMFLIWLFWGLVLTMIPFIIIGLIVGLILQSIKNKKSKKKKSV